VVCVGGVESNIPYEADVRATLRPTLVPTKEEREKAER
jgi:hypothetical protein